MTVIGSNIGSLRAANASSAAGKALSTSMERLSTGKRINSAKDDAAGLAIASRMTSSIKSMSVAIRNANDGISLTQTAEGALSEVTNMLQRMKELATQSANGTLGTSERAALQAESKQLISQINDISKSTNFNGVNLFDGSTNELKLQTGVNAGDTVSVKMQSLDTNKLGTGEMAGVAATGGYKATANVADLKALATGDLTINGVAVPASVKTTDTVSTAAIDASAIAKAAAINSVSDQTGVKAVVGKTEMTGTTMTTGGAASVSGNVTINGVVVAKGFATTATDNATTRSKLVDEINKNSGQTGVIARDTGDDKKGIELVAADGRNITVSVSGSLTDALTGLKSGTQTGSYTLVSESGSSIAVGTTSSGKIANSGLGVGTYGAGESAVTTDNRTVVSDAADIKSLGTGDLVINGTAIRAAKADDDTVSNTSTTSSKSASGIATAAAINASSAQTGVTATVNATVLQGGGTLSTASADAANTMSLNGVDISFSVKNGDTAETIRANTIKAINEKSGQTGVVASDEGTGGVTLTAADGRNVSAWMKSDSGAAASSFGLGTLTVAGSGASFSVEKATTANTAPATTNTAYSTVTLHSTKAIDVQSGTNVDNFEALGFEANSYGSDVDGMKLADVDLSSQAGASKAMSAIDNALDQISAQRGNLGAVQNRLEVTVNNLTTTSTNLADARSRIEDTDYSTETAALAKAQILSQASTAMLAQANQSQQNVMSLLR